jgi:hypothetical protein
MSDPDNLVSDELYDIFVDSIYGTGDDGRPEFQEGRLRCALERLASEIVKQTSDLYPPLPPGIPAEITPTIKIGCSRYQHVKTGGFYEVLGPGKLEWDLADVIVYRSEHDGSLWVRPKSEFYDGRFVRVPPRMPPSKDD